MRFRKPRAGYTCSILSVARVLLRARGFLNCVVPDNECVLTILDYSGETGLTTTIQTVSNKRANRSRY